MKNYIVHCHSIRNSLEMINIFNFCFPQYYVKSFVKNSLFVAIAIF